MFAPFDLEGTIYLTASDVIKNFKFDEFDGDEIPLSNMIYDNKLIFETQNVWTLEQDDVVNILSYDVDGTVYTYYKVFMTNTINVFTSVSLDQMSSKAERVEESFLAGYYEHQGLFGDHMFSWDSYITWNHWDFGDIRGYGFDNNYFEGSLEMTFDISQNTLPEFIDDFAIKRFDYIAVSSASVISAEHGLMSKDVSDILTIIPEKYTEEVNDESGGDIIGDIKGGFEYYWDPDTRLENLGVGKSFDGGMSYQKSGSMIPTTKDGSPIWDAKDTGKSMTDCRIGYGVYSMSPVVQEYYGKLTWKEQNVVTIDKLKLLLPTVYVSLKSYHEEALTETRPIALHGWNRFFQAETEVCFNIWSAYDIEAIEDPEDDPLENPEEYYDMLIWLSLVNGFGGGEQYTADPIDPFSGLFDLFGGIFNFIILVIVAGVGLYVFVKVGVPYMRKKAL